MQMRQVLVLCYLQILRRFFINHNSSGMRRTSAYDAVNRITQITDSNGRSISYQYDAAGNRTTMTTPDSRTIAYTYDFNNLLTGITTPDVGNFNFAYDANNRRTTRTLPNGTTAAYSYDQDSRLTGIQTAKNTTTIDSVNYTYDNAGNRITKTQPAANYNYTYDNIYRLTQATPSTGTSETYTYDQVGNRLTKVPDALPSVNETTQYSYDDENRLTGVQITQGSNVKQLSFAYDPFGRRIKKTVSPSGGGSGEETNYVYDGQNIIMEYDQNGNITAKYTHGPNIDEPLAVQQGTNTYYYHADGLGSITALSNASGSIVQTYSYDSFGNMTATGSISQPFTYTAREYDSETGMYFYRARYYDPKVGRFVTKDPIGFGGGDVNLYSYTGQNPVNYTDPYGLLSSAEALAHYLGGSGTALSMQFNEINTSSVRVTSFPQVQSELKKGCGKRTVQIDSRSFFSTSGDAAETVGNITLRLQGSLTICGCNWSFEGTLKSFDDTYDFNRSTHRSFLGELSTTVGNYLPGKSYTIHIYGAKPISASGTI
jgi:RHS repeat-associated protein